MEVSRYLGNLTVLLNQAIRKLYELEYANVSRKMIIQAKKNVQRFNDIINRTICSVLETDSSEFREVALFIVTRTLLHVSLVHTPFRRWIRRMISF
jgi:hypothetical protein